MSSNASFRKSVVSWDKDVNYELNRSGLSSLQVLMNWLTVPTNFYSYVNPRKRKNKEDVLIDITQYFRNKGISYRQSKSIRSKIDHILSSYKKATRWLMKQPAPENIQQTRRIKSHLLKHCREYDQIKPLFDASVDPGWPSQDEHTENARSIMNSDEDEEEMEEENTEHGDLVSVTDINNTDDESGALHDMSQTTEETSRKEFEWRQRMETQMLALKRSKLAIKKNVAIIDNLKHMFQQGLISREQYKEMTLEAFDGLRNA